MEEGGGTPVRLPVSRLKSPRSVFGIPNPLEPRKTEKNRDFIAQKTRNAAEVSLRRSAGSSRKSVRGGEKHAGAKREEKVGLPRNTIRDAKGALRSK